MLIKVAKAFGVHPNQLLLRAALTPILSPIPSPAPVSSRSPQDAREPKTFYVTEQERTQLDHYLQFLRDTELIELAERVSI